MFDFGYVFRVIALNWRSKSKVQVKDLFSEFILPGRCWINDLDINWHMNNSRYLRECDFGRIDWLMKTGFWNAMLETRKSNVKDLNLVVSSCQAQFRRSIELGDRFKIYTRLCGWDDRALYMEQWMVTDKDNQIAFALLVRIALTSRSVTPQMLIDALQLGAIQSPELSETMRNFKENHQISSSGVKAKL